jgi:peroxiredoxin
MALTPSNMLPLGTEAPDFSLKDVTNKQSYDFKSIRGSNGTVIMFICKHCPYVIHIQNEIVKLAKDYQKKEVEFVAISSNDIVNYPDDSPENLKAQAAELGFTFPYLYDDKQEVARAYDAACTPDFYIFDRSDSLVYRGRLDESRPGNDIPVTGKDLRRALDNLLQGLPQEEMQYPSMGCNIKWFKS